MRWAIPEPPSPHIRILYGQGGTTWRRDSNTWVATRNSWPYHIRLTWQRLLAAYGPLTNHKEPP